MPPSRAKLHLAVGAFAAEEVTLGQAAEIAGGVADRTDAQSSRRCLPLHYGPEEFADDMQTIASLKRRPGSMFGVSATLRR